MIGGLLLTAAAICCNTVVYEQAVPAWLGILPEALFIIAMVCTLAIWAWMFADCIAELAANGRSPRRVAWLGVVFAFFPSAYLYYFLERRRRQ